HYGLGLAFGDPAWGVKKEVPEGTTGPPPMVDPDELQKLAATVADRIVAPDQRRDRALALARRVGAYMKSPGPRFQSRLEPLHELAATLGQVWEQEGDESV